MIKIDSQVKGLAELDKFLSTLPVDVQLKILPSSLRVAAKPIMDQAVQNIIANFGSSRRYSGVLASHIVRQKRSAKYYAARITIKVKRPKGKAQKLDPAPKINGVTKPYGDDPFYGRFLEFGTSKMSARPWLKPAAMARQDDAGRELNRDLQKKLAKWCKANGVKFAPAGV